MENTEVSRMTDENRDERLQRMMRERGTSLVRSCTLLLKDPGLAEDAVQESFIRGCSCFCTLLQPL